MSSAVGSTEATAPAQRRLRLANDARRHLRAGEQREQGQRIEQLMSMRAGREVAPAQVLLAGADADGRSAMLGELRNMLPAGTRFVEACETWEVLARAANSQMVVLTADLGDISSASLVRLLGRRHPDLPVLALGPWAAPGARPSVGSASV